jgi:hypothetical protein
MMSVSVPCILNSLTGEVVRKLAFGEFLKLADEKGLKEIIDGRPTSCEVKVVEIEQLTA